MANVPTPEEQKKIDEINDLAKNFLDHLHDLGGTDIQGDRYGSANLTLAARHIEDAVFRACKHITD
jgi:hypothetical protein